MKKKTASSLLAGALVLVTCAPCCFAESGADLVKEYTFRAEDPAEPFYEAPEKIREKGRTYKLSEVEYTIEDNVSFQKKYTVDSKEDFTPEQPEHTARSGRTVTLEATDISWEEKKAELTQEYKSRTEIPEKTTAEIMPESSEEGEGEIKPIEVELSLKDVRDISRFDDFTAPAVFYGSAPDVRKFAFGDQIITITGESPVWEGYQEDVKEYLGVSGKEYNVTGGSWEGGFEEADGGVMRRAVFTGTKYIQAYEAVYTGQFYEAVVTYSGIDTGFAAEATATASYERVMGIAEGILIGAGILILALAAAAVLFAIRRKKRKEEKKSPGN